MKDEDLKHRHEKTTAVTILGSVCNIFLALVKCIAGWLGNSHALFADGVHSFSDLIADVIVLLASKFGGKAADKEHPYGHERIETAATIAVAGFLLFAGLGIIVSGIQHVLNPNHDADMHSYVLWIALLALIINEAIFRITLHIAKKIESEMLVAHAWHRRSDAAASLIVLIGIAGSMIGIRYLDGVAAMVVGIFILKMAWQMGRGSFDELIDRGLNETELKKIKETIQSVEGVLALHQLRTRLMAGKIFADVHVIVDPFLSVSEGHYIGDWVYFLLDKNFSNLEDITVHVDSENDEFDHTARSMPSRKQILLALENIKSELPEYENMHLKNIHYIQDYLILELVFPTFVLSKIPAKNLEEIYLKKINVLFPVRKVKIFFAESQASHF